MFQFISVFLYYLVQVLVRSAMNQYSFFYIVLVFWNILVLVLVFSKRIAIILVLVFVLVTKIALM